MPPTTIYFRTASDGLLYVRILPNMRSPEQRSSIVSNTIYSMSSDRSEEFVKLVEACDFISRSFDKSKWQRRAQFEPCTLPSLPVRLYFSSPPLCSLSSGRRLRIFASCYNWTSRAVEVHQT